MSIELVLLRHAQPAWVEDGVARDDPRLSELGQRQAEHVAQHLKEQAPLDAIWVSQLQRAQETAAPIADAVGLTVQTEAGFNEVQLPSWEGAPPETIRAFFRNAQLRKWPQWQTEDYPGEGTSAFRTRVHEALLRRLEALRIRPIVDTPLWAAEEKKRVLIVGHGGTNGVLLEHLLGFAAAPWPWLRLPHHHCGMSQIRGIATADAHALCLERFNDVSHFPEPLRTA